MALETAVELPDDTGSTLRSIAFSLMALFNLRLGDHLVPCAPLQVGKIVAGGRQFNNAVVVAVERRDEPSVAAIESTLREFRDIVLGGSQAAKLQTALELYGSQSLERDSKVRFLLLVMAMECLATPVDKHPAALRLLASWHSELKREMEHFPESAPEFVALEALQRELFFRREDSLRSQVRRLMLRVSEGHATKAEFPTRAVKVYDKRSVLVHEGHLPYEELVQLDQDARELVEAALAFSLVESRSQLPG